MDVVVVMRSGGKVYHCASLGMMSCPEVYPILLSSRASPASFPFICFFHDSSDFFLYKCRGLEDYLKAKLGVLFCCRSIFPNKKPTLGYCIHICHLLFRIQKPSERDHL